MREEFDLIERYFRPLASNMSASLNLEDDAGILSAPEKRAYVLATDTLVASVHYLPDDPPEQIAQKALRVNLSDLAAMGATPFGYLLNLAVAETVTESWIAQFAEGLAADQVEYGVGLIGGDTTRSSSGTVITITAVGTVPHGQALRRRGASAGDHVVVSGTVGDAALGLMAAQGHLNMDVGSDSTYLIERYRWPLPRITLGKALLGQGLASAAIDISDGLVADLGHVCTASKVGMAVELAAVPLSTEVQRYVERDMTILHKALTGGDDYELAFTVPPAQIGEVAALARSLDLPLTRIGYVTEGCEPIVRDSENTPLSFTQRGWSHF